MDWQRYLNMSCFMKDRNQRSSPERNYGAQVTPQICAYLHMVLIYTYADNGKKIAGVEIGFFFFHTKATKNLKKFIYIRVREVELTISRLVCRLIVALKFFASNNSRICFRCTLYHWC